MWRSVIGRNASDNLIRCLTVNSAGGAVVEPATMKQAGLFPAKTTRAEGCASAGRTEADGRTVGSSSCRNASHPRTAYRSISSIASWISRSLSGLASPGRPIRRSAGLLPRAVRLSRGSWIAFSGGNQAWRTWPFNAFYREVSSSVWPPLSRVSVAVNY